MKKFLSHSLALYLVLQPALAFAVYETPAALQQGFANDGTPRSFSGEIHGNARTPDDNLVYISVWSSGEMAGAGVRQNSLNMKLTADVSIPKANVHVRVKFAMRKVQESVFVQLQSIDATFDDELNRFGLSYLMKKWIEIPLSEEYMAMMESGQSDTTSINDIFELTHTKTKSGHSYSLRLAEDFLKEFSNQIGSSQMNFHIKIDTSPSDAFLFGKLYFSAEQTDSNIVVTGTSQKINKAVVITRPQPSITLEELMNKYPNTLNSLPWTPLQSLNPVSSYDGTEEGTSFTDDEFDGEESGYYESSSDSNSSSSVSNTRPSRRTILQRQAEEQAARTKRMQSSSSSSSSAPSSSTEGTLGLVLPSNGLSRGNPLASVVIVEVGDYECPYCVQFHRNIFPQLDKDYIAAGTVRYVYRNFPLSYHLFATHAAMVVECTRDQSNKLAIEVQDKIYASDSLEPQAIEDILRSISGLDADAVLSCAVAYGKQDVILQDIKDANAAGIEGVSTFWIIGPDGSYETIFGAQSFETFKEILDRMLRK